MLNKITNFREIHHKYNGFIVDIWGVLHGGDEAFPNALECLENLKLLNKKIILFSNAPRRAANIKPILAQKNISKNLYYKIISSGELAFESLINNSFTAKKYFFIGPDRDLNLLDNTDYMHVTSIDDAEFIIVTGINENLDEEPFDKEMLKYASTKKLPMLCVNPDLYVFKNDKKILCAGSIAEYYKNLNGEVAYFGKPFNEGYQKCQEILNLPKSEILAIGDSYRTDITGANSFGIDSLFISSGVDRGAALSPTTIDEASKPIIKPTFIMDHLNW